MLAQHLVRGAYLVEFCFECFGQVAPIKGQLCIGLVVTFVSDVHHDRAAFCQMIREVVRERPTFYYVVAFRLGEWTQRRCGGQDSSLEYLPCCVSRSMRLVSAGGSRESGPA